MENDEYLMTEVEYDVDTENPREIHLIIKSPHKDLTGEELYDALYVLLHDILEPELKKRKKKTKKGDSLN